MKCPHCLIGIHYKSTLGHLIDVTDTRWYARHGTCSECGKAIVYLEEHSPTSGHFQKRRLVHPRNPARPGAPDEVTEPYRGDYVEGCAVIDDSPKASAALSRRCLQALLRDEQKVKHGNLADEIEEAMPKLPSHLSDAIDGVRNIGNFGAHPMKSTNTGEIINVEPGEAEWLLETLQGLFDHYFVQPARLKAKRAALDAKLADAGKPPMK